MHLLVLGGSGRAGRAVCTEAATRGHRVRSLSRREPSPALPAGVEDVRGDTVSGAGLPAAMAGIDAVVDCTDIASLDRAKATGFFTGSVTRAAAAAAAAGVRTYALLSVVGVDRVPLAYYEAKLRQEQTLLAVTPGSVTRPLVVRTTQFHEFALQVLARDAFGPFAFVPSMRIRPVALTAVARHLVSVTESGSWVAAPELSGPQEERLPDLVRRVARARGPRKIVVPVPLLGAAGRANRSGALLPDHPVVDPESFADWLAGSDLARRTAAEPAYPEA
jgi:uncharacterized protein YbjT (DUF2867 family)